jgi:type IV secretion system protein VirB10
MAEEKNTKVEHVVEPEVKNELSQVASNPAKNMVIVGIVGVVFSAIFYNMFIAGYKKEEKPETPKPAESQIVKPNSDVADLPEIPTLPEPKLVEPTPPPPLPAAPVESLPQLPAAPVEAPTAPALPTNIASDGILTGDSEEVKRRKEAKRKSSITVMGGGGSTPKPLPTAVSKMPSLEYTLGRGKVIDAVLESAVNTDFGGEIRAVISRDVFSESGRVILIPKGSRIFGTYSTGVGASNGRVEIVWDRIDLASGYRLTLTALSTDNLGRKGVEGRVDNKYKEKMANAVLTSAFNVLVAKGIDSAVPPVLPNQTANANSATISNIQSQVVSLAQDATADFNRVCSALQSAIIDQGSSAFQQAVTGCQVIVTNAAGLTTAQQKTAALTLATSIATSLSASTAQNTTPTKAQQAAEEGYKNITETLKGMIAQQNFEPTITIDQGRPLKIYVTKDYEFPKEAIFKSRLLK